ncbi:MAG: DMT family transporter [Lapillicoccus sp.]
MSLLGVVALSLGSAAFFSLATALKHRSAGQMPHLEHFRVGDLAGFALATLRHPLWLGGILADVGGLALQVVALHVGALAVVQLLLVVSVLFSLVVAHWIARTRISRRELGLGLVLVLSVAGFLLVSGVLTAQADQPDRLPAILAGVATLGVVVSLVAVSRRFTRRKWGSRRAAALLGVSVGVIYAGTAALIKTCTGIVTAHGASSLLVSWQLYALLAAGASGLFLAQMAFQAGPLAASLPATATADPLVSVVLGVAVFDEQLHTGAAALLLSALCLVLLLVSVTQLSRVRAVVEQSVPHTSGTGRVSA